MHRRPALCGSWIVNLRPRQSYCFDLNQHGDQTGRAKQETIDEVADNPCPPRLPEDGTTM
jgi:hypothetical protein